MSATLSDQLAVAPRTERSTWLGIGDAIFRYLRRNPALPVGLALLLTLVLFVFVEDRKMIIQVGYGLEGALPDVTAFNITEYRMKPQFVAGNYENGLRIGIDAICKAIRPRIRRQR